MAFFQDPPELGNQYDDDAQLREYLARTVPPDVLAAIEPELRDPFLASDTASFAIPRPGQSDEVASAIMFLIENEFVTGTTVDVDGGALLS